MPPEPPAPLIGRDRIVADTVDRVREGTGTLLLAPGGGGRSRILAEIATVLERSAVRVARLTATTSVSAVPFGLFLGLLDQPTTRRIAQSDTLGRAVLVRAAVQDLALQAVVVDEVSLVDPASAAFLLELARDGAVVVAGLTTGRRVRDAVRELALDDRTVTVVLPPLSRAEVTEVTRGLLHGPVDGAAVAALADASEGNPGALRELVRDGVTAGTLARQGVLWRLAAPLPAPRTLRRRVADRLDPVPAELREWVVAVAVADQIADDLGELLAADTVADAAERDGWTEHDDQRGTTRIRQRAVRTAIVESLGSRARRAAARRLLEAVGALQRPLLDPERIAVGTWRLELGEPLDPAEALALARLTALAASDLSERLLREAVERGGGLPAELALADQLKRRGRRGALGDLIGTVRPDAGDAAGAAHLVRVRATVIGFAERDPQRALQLLDEHVAVYGDADEVRAVRSGLLLSERRIAESIAIAREVADGPRGFASQFAAIFLTLGLTLSGDLAGATAVATRMHAGSDPTDIRLPDGDLVAEWLLGWAPLTVSVDVTTATAAGIRGYDRSLEAGLDQARPQSAHLLGLCRILQADPDSAVQLLREAEAGDGPWHDSWLPVVTASLAEALALAGDPEGADHVLDQLQRMDASAASLNPADLAAAQVAALRDRPDEAVQLARSAERRARAQGATVEVFDAVYAALRHGDPAAAADLLALGPVPAGEARDEQRAHARGLLEGDAVELDRVAGALWALGLRLWAIEAGQAALQLRNDQGLDTAAASERLAVWALHTPGLRLPNSRIREATGLTARERQVVHLAARGLPDRAIAAQLGISVRTAQTHIGRAFGKLGVHRRTDLRPILERLE